MGYLPLQVRQVDRVVVDDADDADAGRREIENDWRAEPARADDENAGLEELRLTRPADFGQHDMARVALDLFVAEFHASIIAALRAFRNRGAAARRSVSRVLCPREGGDGHSSGTSVAGRLVRPTRTGDRGGAIRPLVSGACRPYPVLLPARLAVPASLPPPRCALAAPFHPCPRDLPENAAPGRAGRFAFCGAVSRVAPPGVTRRRASVEPGLSSPPKRSGRPTV